MGVTRKFMMPLLSTLAALVIIVHSDEEDTQSDYTRELRPRLIDSGMHSYEQPWRVVESKIESENPTQTNPWDNNSTEESRKRRRPRRKRKRRPQLSLSDSLDPQETKSYAEEPLRPYLQIDLSDKEQSTQIPKTRRKKLDSKSTSWSDVSLQRPYRRRGNRRKRPSLKLGPELSEFNVFQGHLKNESAPVTTDSSEIKDILDINQNQHSTQYESNIQNINNSDMLDILSKEQDNEKPQEKLTTFKKEKINYSMQHRGPYLQEDKSLSEFSLEVTQGADESNINDKNHNLHRKLNDKLTGVFQEYDKAEDKLYLNNFHGNTIHDFLWLLRQYDLNVFRNDVVVRDNLKKTKAKDKMLIKDKLNTKTNDTRTTYSMVKKMNNKVQEWNTELLDEYMIDSPVDPVTLKEILKRSNGTSLSEILQVHNLSLADLLEGKENALSILKSKGSLENNQSILAPLVNNLTLSEIDTDITKESVEHSNETNILLNLEPKHEQVQQNEFDISTQTIQRLQKDKVDNRDNVEMTTVKPENYTSNIIGFLRYPVNVRRKLRMRPILNSTRKSPLSRDVIALNARRYLNQRKNSSKSTEWRSIVPLFTNISNADSDVSTQIETTTVQISTVEHFTTQISTGNQNQSILHKDDNNKYVNYDTKERLGRIPLIDSINVDRASDDPLLDDPHQHFSSTIETVPLTQGSHGNHLNNRIKKKRRRQKYSTTESPKIKYLLGKEMLPLLNHITTQEPIMVTQVDKDFATVLEDFMTTLTPSNSEATFKPVKHVYIASTTSRPPSQTTTYMIGEKTAKVEIDEIFKDIQTSARLSKILMERNMTLRELVEHRERGSSHVHLADIFYNASKEPNPPEPFLSKSVIEPISKETYPLRAILEANSHDVTTIKPTINDPSIPETSFNDIPVVMDFSNNVNENAENMGIMSLFNNYSKTIINDNNNKDSEIRSNRKGVMRNNTKQLNKAMPTVRQNRVLTDNSNQDDVVSWNEIFSLMRKNYKNETKVLFESIQNEPELTDTTTKINQEDEDGYGSNGLEDLEHFKTSDNYVSPISNEKSDINFLERSDAAIGNFEKIPSQNKSITVITASIAGLAMVLFIFIYAVFKWKKRKTVTDREKNFTNERIPTPVFEHRKGHKNNSSTRSISPMLSTSNIYTLNTLDSRNGKDSPEYMWDTLHKPFQ